MKENEYLFVLYYPTTTITNFIYFAPPKRAKAASAASLRLYFA